MSGKELLMNMDLVKFPRDSHVLLTHAQDAYSIGLIQTPYDGAVLIAAFKNPMMNFGVPLSPQFLLSSLDVVVAKHTKHSFDLAIHMLKTWAAARSDGIGVERRPIRLSDFTEFVKDAPMGESQFMRLGGGELTKVSQAERAQKMGHIRDLGFNVPIRPIVNTFRDKLA